MRADLIPYLTVTEYIQRRQYFLLRDIDPEQARRSGMAARRMLSALAQADSAALRDEYNRLKEKPNDP